MKPAKEIMLRITIGDRMTYGNMVLPKGFTFETKAFPDGTGYLIQSGIPWPENLKGHELLIERTPSGWFLEGAPCIVSKV